MPYLIIIAIVVFGVYKCTGGDFGTDKIFGPPDTLPLSRYDDVEVNVYFYFPGGREAFLGETKGASSCGSMARSYAARNDMSRNREWSYICCTKENGSSCYRKIR